jgi:hypothetical protein
MIGEHISTCDFAVLSLSSLLIFLIIISNRLGANKELLMLELLLSILVKFVSAV